MKQKLAQGRTPTICRSCYINDLEIGSTIYGDGIAEIYLENTSSDISKIRKAIHTTIEISPDGSYLGNIEE